MVPEAHLSKALGRAHGPTHGRGVPGGPPQCMLRTGMRRAPHGRQAPLRAVCCFHAVPSMGSVFSCVGPAAPDDAAAQDAADTQATATADTTLRGGNMLAADSIGRAQNHWPRPLPPPNRTLPPASNAYSHPACCTSHKPDVLRFRASWNRAAGGYPVWATIAEAGERLITAALPKGGNATHEMQARLEAWESGSLELLLERIDQQQLVARQQMQWGERNAMRPTTIADAAARKANAARHKATEGAYRSAAVTLTRDLLRTTTQQQMGTRRTFSPGPQTSQQP